MGNWRRIQIIGSCSPEGNIPTVYSLASGGNSQRYALNQPPPGPFLFRWLRPGTPPLS